MLLVKFSHLIYILAVGSKKRSTKYRLVQKHTASGNFILKNINSHLVFTRSGFLNNAKPISLTRYSKVCYSAVGLSDPKIAVSTCNSIETTKNFVCACEKTLMLNSSASLNTASTLRGK